jgi:hypothetical protein
MSLSLVFPTDIVKGHLKRCGKTLLFVKMWKIIISKNQIGLRGLGGIISSQTYGGLNSG